MDERHSPASNQSESNRGILNAVKDRATTEFSNEKGRATEVVDALAHAVRRTTDQLRQDSHGTIAAYVDRAAEQLERLSGTIKQRDIGELMSDVRNFARRQPTLFIGGSFVAGLLVARFLKSSSDEGADYDAREETAGSWETPRYGPSDHATPSREVPGRG